MHSAASGASEHSPGGFFSKAGTTMARLWLWLFLSLWGRRWWRRLPGSSSSSLLPSRARCCCCCCCSATRAVSLTRTSRSTEGTKSTSITNTWVVVTRSRPTFRSRLTGYFPPLLSASSALYRTIVRLGQDCRSRSSSLARWSLSVVLLLPPWWLSLSLPLPLPLSLLLSLLLGTKTTATIGSVLHLAQVSPRIHIRSMLVWTTRVVEGCSVVLVTPHEEYDAAISFVLWMVRNGSRPVLLLSLSLVVSATPPVTSKSRRCPLPLLLATTALWYRFFLVSWNFRGSLLLLSSPATAPAATAPAATPATSTASSASAPSSSATEASASAPTAAPLPAPSFSSPPEGRLFSVSSPAAASSSFRW
mmetsp:Transcript_4972/g.11184  ORF Transcript_4972/g.11184 Transcript_4972/m.11184 type:complete len:362 (+) Transcript_4972:816-1901(+)